MAKRGNNYGKCLYCPEVDKLSKKHFLPQTFGKFKGCRTLIGKLCVPCNNLRLGKCVDQLVGPSPVGLAKYFCGYPRSATETSSVLYKACHGLSPAGIKAKDPFFSRYDIGWEFDSDRTVLLPQSQLVLRRPDFEQILLPLHVDLLKGHGLDRARNALGLDNPRVLQAIFKGDECELADAAYRRILRTRKRLGNYYLEFESSRFHLAIKATENLDMYRAIAGIAFHYVLLYFDGYTGFEDEFNGVRDFIAGRFHSKRIVEPVTNGPLHQAFGKEIVPSKVSHFMLATRRADKITVFIAFYVGVESKLPTPEYKIELGKKPNHIIRLPEAISHSFTYFRGGPQAGYDGEMSAMQVFQPN